MGSICAKQQGGDTRSHHIEAFAAVILAAVEAQKDISLVELAEMLRMNHGASFAASTVWRCLDRHAMTLKKNSARGGAGTARRRRSAQSLVQSAA
jgi:transposase